MAERTEFWIEPKTVSAVQNSKAFDYEALNGQATAYLAHLTEEYGTLDSVTLWSLLFYCILPTLQEQLTLHEKIKETVLFPEFGYSNIQRELKIVHHLLDNFEELQA